MPLAYDVIKIVLKSVFGCLAILFSRAILFYAVLHFCTGFFNQSVFSSEIFEEL